MGKKLGNPKDGLHDMMLRCCRDKKGWFSEDEIDFIKTANPMITSEFYSLP